MNFLQIRARHLSKVMCFMSIIALLAASAWARPKITELPSILLTYEDTYDSQPSAFTAKDGTVWMAWIGNSEAKADNVYVRSLPPGSKPSNGWTPVERVTSASGEYMRPTLAQDAIGRVWVFWTANTGKLAGIYGAMRENGRWSAPMSIAVGSEANQNQEVCVDREGKMWLVWQRFTNGSYDIYLKSFDGRSWSKDTPIAQSSRNEWDPVIVSDAKGVVWIAWSAYEDSGYTLYLAPFADNQIGPRVTVACNGTYNIHPWLCADAQDRIWITWDSMKPINHGYSGQSTITGANLKDIDHRLSLGSGIVESYIKLACYDGKQLYSPISLKSPGSVVAKQYSDSHAGMPKVAVDDAGNVYITHRAHFVQETKRRSYYWDVFVEQYSKGKWQPTLKLARSDGPQEEVAITSLGRGGMLAAYQMEHRDSFKGGLGPEQKEDLHPERFVNVNGYDGDIYVAQVQFTNENTRSEDVMKPSAAAPSSFSDKPLSRAAHTVSKDKKVYNLYWGDLHKHSNVSRCTAGLEPGPADHYVYSHDTCNYDFMALTEHSEHTSQYEWWRLQELADLYYIPGSFTPMIGYEWTAEFPIGNKNVIFEGRPAPLVRSRVDGCRTGNELFAILKGEKAVVIPHTTASVVMGCDWSEHDPELQRLVEVFQARRGSSEGEDCPRFWPDPGREKAPKPGFVQNGLAKGYRMGMICSSDHGYGVSYAVVYAEKLDRKSIFEALYNRRCYGSTAYGTIIEFWSDGHFMGEEYKSSASPKLELFASAPVNLRSVEIIKNGKVVYSQGGVDKPIGKKEIRVSWSDPNKITAPAYYYLRVIREDDEMAWSSPIWVDPQEE
ncbi:MAG: DUF3604 domain-containing protein [Armatimonadota bacterium]|nr:DUF3604 domain-containing protein [Armatimonadota bacterium]